MLCFSPCLSTSLSAVLWLPLSLSVFPSLSPPFFLQNNHGIFRLIALCCRSLRLIAGGTAMGVKGVSAGGTSAAQSRKPGNDTWWFVVVCCCSATSVYLQWSSTLQINCLHHQDFASLCEWPHSQGLGCTYWIAAAAWRCFEILS